MQQQIYSLSIWISFNEKFTFSTYTDIYIFFFAEYVQLNQYHLRRQHPQRKRFSAGAYRATSIAGARTWKYPFSPLDGSSISEKSSTTEDISRTLSELESQWSYLIIPLNTFSNCIFSLIKQKIKRYLILWYPLWFL